MPKKKRGMGHASSRKQRRAASLAAAAEAAAATDAVRAQPRATVSSSTTAAAAQTPQASGQPSLPRRPVASARTSDRRGIRRALPIVVLLGVGTLIAVALFLAGQDGERTANAEPSIVVGTPRGQVLPAPTPEPTEQPSPEATPDPTAEPTLEPTPNVTAQPTPGPAPASTPRPAPAPATPAPTPVVVAAAGPSDSVAAFYGHVAAGRFDAAYALWSDRMRVTYSRQENLDERFDDTRSITFEQLSVVEQRATTATVQANFVETYDSGSSRRFVGYWELILVDGRWLLDAPHY